MAGKMHCRECCPDCVIATDDFNRADATAIGVGVNLGPNWEEISGFGHISNQELLCAASGSNTRLRFTVPHPGGAEAAVRVKVKFKFHPDNHEVQIHVGVQDQDDLITCTIGRDPNDNCGTIGFFKTVAGVDTSLGVTQGIGEPLPPDVWHTAEVCLEPSVYPTEEGVLRAKVTPNGGKAYGNEYAGDFDLPGGLYVGLQGSEQCRFDDFRFEWMGHPGLYDNCPKCTTPCLIEEDDFSTDNPCKWNVISGTWFRNVEASVSGSGGIMLCAVHHPASKTYHHVTVRVYVAAGLTPRVLVNAKADGSSYHWAALSLSGTTLTLTIGKDGATLDTETSTLTAAGFVEVTVCYDGSTLTATANGDTIFAASDAVTDGIFVGLGGTSGGERFDDFVFNKHYSTEDPADVACPNCLAYLPCQCGIDNPAPANFKITISGVTGCAAHNRTVIAIGGCGVPCWCGVSVGCVGGVDGSGVPSSDPSWAAGSSTIDNPAVELYFWPLSPPSITVCVSYIDSGFVQRRHRFRKEYTERPTCATLRDTLPLFSGAGAPCEYLNAIATIEALP